MSTGNPHHDGRARDRSDGSGKWNGPEKGPDAIGEFSPLDPGAPDGTDNSEEWEGEWEEDERWDANDPRRRHDQMAPPTEPCECYCLHCGRTFMSDQMWFQKVIGDPQGFEGFWMCPTPNCSGAGFTFDIFPTDPDHPANGGWHSCDEDGEEGEGEEWSEDNDPEAEYDPEESKYKALEEFEGDDDDLEGEEWKYGLQPGERPEAEADPGQWSEGRREWEEQQRMHDQPDQRPRELDWSDREDRQGGTGKPWGEDDIPF